MSTEAPTRLAPHVGTPDGRFAAVQALTLAQRLLALDDLWTALTDAARSVEEPLAADELDVMEGLVGEMRDGLYAIDARAYDVRMMLAGLDDETFEQALDSIAGSPGAPPNLRSMLSSALPDYEPRGATITACDYLRAHWGAESELLGEKLAAIRRGEAAEGDFRFPFRCAGFLMLVGAGVAAGIVTGGAAVGVGLSVATSVGWGVYGWKDSECAEVLAAIGGGRR